MVKRDSAGNRRILIVDEEKKIVVTVHGPAGTSDGIGWPPEHAPLLPS